MAACRCPQEIDIARQAAGIDEQATDPKREDQMADLRLKIEGADAQKAAAELGVALEFEFDPIGRVGVAPAPLVVAPPQEATGQQEADGVSTIAMTLGIPQDVIAGDGLEQKLHLLERLRRLIAIAEQHRESGTKVCLQVGDSLRDLAGMEPEDILNAVEHPG